MSEQQGDFHDEFIEADQIDEVVPDEGIGGGEPMSDDDDGEGQVPEGDDVEKIEIDMSNNAHGYFDQHTDSIFLVKSHPTLPLVVTGGGDDRGFLWVTHKTGEATKVTELSGHTESVIAGGFTFGGDYLVTGDMTGQVRVWKSRRKGEMWEFVDSCKEVEEVVWISFHPSQNIFAVGASDGSVWCYALEPKLNNLSVLSSHAGATTSGGFIDTADLDNLSLVTISEDSTVVRWNVYQSTATYTLGPNELHGERPWISLSVSPTEKTFAIGAQDGMLCIINASNGQLLHKIETGASAADEESKSIESIAWGPGAKVLAVGNVGGEVYLYDLGSWQRRRTLKMDDAITQLEFVKDSPYLLSSCNAGQIIKWDARSGSELWKGVGHNDGVLGFVVQENGNRVISAGDEGVSLIFDTTQSNQLTTTSTS